MDSKISRDYTYDWLRLMATIFVVIGHSLYLGNNTTYGGVIYNIPETVNIAYDSTIFYVFKFMSGWVYGFHMPLFFMLSGAVFALKPIEPMDTLVKNKAKRLLIPYYLYGWLFMLPVKFFGDFYDADGLKKAMKGMLSGTDDGHLWFLTALFWVFIIAAILLKVMNRFGIKSVYIFLLLCGLIQAFSPYVSFDILRLKEGLGNIFWFALGFTFETERKKHQPWSTKSTVLGIIALSILECCHLKFNILDEFFVVVVACFLSFLVADFLSRTCQGVTKTKVWKIVIRNLFYIYLLHDPLEYTVLRISMNGHWLNSAIGCYLYLFSRTVVVCFVCIILGELIWAIKKKIAPAVAK